MSRPGAMFQEIVKNAVEAAETDTLVIIGGTNNLNSKKTDEQIKSEFNLESLKKLKCQIILFEIFPCYDPNIHDSKMRGVNIFLSNKSKDFDNLTVIRSGTKRLFIRSNPLNYTSVTYFLLQILINLFILSIKAPLSCDKHWQMSI